MVDICSLPASTVVKLPEGAAELELLPCVPEVAGALLLELEVAGALLLELEVLVPPPQAARDRTMAEAMAKARIFFILKTPFQIAGGRPSGCPEHCERLYIRRYGESIDDCSKTGVLSTLF